MNTADILKYGHRTFTKALEGIPRSDWDTPGICGVWSVKDIVAHLASYEQFLIEILNNLIDPNTNIASLTGLAAGYDAFNNAEVNKRASKTADEVLQEYNDGYEQGQRLLESIPPEKQDAEGSLPWYGDKYDLQDFIVYTYYGHKREHAAQLDVFRDRAK